MKVEKLGTFQVMTPWRFALQSMLIGLSLISCAVLGSKGFVSIASCATVCVRWPRFDKVRGVELSIGFSAFVFYTIVCVNLARFGKVSGARFSIGFVDMVLYSIV